MPKKSLDILTESMYYVLMSFHAKEMCGNEITEYIASITKGRIHMGPGTLYTILSTFSKENLIKKSRQDGRKIYYAITEKGEEIYQFELERLHKCIMDAEKIEMMRETKMKEGRAIE